MTNKLDEIKRQISGSAQRIVWGRQRIRPEMIAFDGSGQMFEDMWSEVSFAAAQNLFEMINDGQLYCLRVERVETNFDMTKYLTADNFRATDYSQFPDISIGYEGTLHRVYRNPVRVPTYTPAPLSGFTYAQPTWTQIRREIRRRLEKDLRPNSIVRWMVKNILARICYLPAENPDWWGVSKF